MEPFVWAHAQVPLGILQRELVLVPRGLNQAACPGRGSWHTAKFHRPSSRPMSNHKPPTRRDRFVGACRHDGFGRAGA
ncbi:hypothetical protein VP01_77g9 [Puccinia sorghi]|uniref:Uncharacterized protein n=1 Tax=Puccinia sorghi TaxID=27349 RepID=A0A0L6UDB0_9BASI|nr:hypothetical protein VP01_77g9 [Puccinia sorghi]